MLAYESYVELAEKLNAMAPGNFAKKSFFLTTGAEAVENAVKVARAYTKRSAVIAFGGGFHGRTLMGMALTGKVAPYKAGFGPFPAEVFHGIPSMTRRLVTCIPVAPDIPALPSRAGQRTACSEVTARL